jgi:hypothetical protein
MQTLFHEYNRSNSDKFMFYNTVSCKGSFSGIYTGLFLGFSGPFVIFAPYLNKHNV